MHRLFFLSLITCITFITQAAEDWPTFRGPTRQGISHARNVPVSWNSTNNIAWKRPIKGKGWSSPVLSNGRLYLTTGVEKIG